MAENRLSLVEIDQSIWLKSTKVDFDPNLAEFGQNLTVVGQIWPKLFRIWRNLIRFGPESAELGSYLFGTIWPGQGGFWPTPCHKAMLRIARSTELPVGFLRNTMYPFAPLPNKPMFPDAVPHEVTRPRWTEPRH